MFSLFCALEMKKNVHWHCMGDPLNEENLQRELTGLRQAMELTGAKEGIILTFQQKDEIDNIPVRPVWQWCNDVE